MARTSPFPRLGAVTLSIAATFLVGQHAVASPSPSASASFTELSIRLIDLTPDDGIGPSITFGTGGGSFFLGQTNATDVFQTFSLAGLPFSPHSETLGQASTAIMAGGLNAQATLDSSLVEISTNAPIDDPYWRHIRHIANNSTMASTLIGDGQIVGEGASTPLSFVLGANTAIVLEGRAVLSASSFAGGQAALTATATPLFGLSPDGSLLSANYYSGSAAQAGLFWTFDDEMFEDVDESKFFQATAETYALGDDLRSADQTFALTLTNDSSASRAGQLLMATNVNVYERLEVLERIPLVTNPIPEPATYALMGLGLVGLAWARRRHTH